jgi:hypothetical protein
LSCSIRCKVFAVTADYAAFFSLRGFASWAQPPEYEDPSTPELSTIVTCLDEENNVVITIEAMGRALRDRVGFRVTLQPAEHFSGFDGSRKRPTFSLPLGFRWTERLLPLSSAA